MATFQRKGYTVKTSGKVTKGIRGPKGSLASGKSRNTSTATKIARAMGRAAFGAKGAAVAAKSMGGGGAG